MKRSFSRLAVIPLAIALAGVPLGAAAAEHGHGGHGKPGETCSMEDKGHGSHDHASHGQAAQGVYTVNGVVRSVDHAAGKASITHDPVPSLKWPAMTMTFTESSKGLLKDVKAGDKVRIDFMQKGDVTLIMDIETIR